MNINAKKIKEIAQELEAGMKVYLNKETLEIKSILDWDDIMDNEFWEEEEEEIFNEWPDFMVFTKMESREAFRVMEEFVDSLEDESFCEVLAKILSRKSPFANFKAEIESSPYRDDWYEFKRSSYEDYVREQLCIE